MCSGSEAGSYFRCIDVCVYHSTLGLKRNKGEEEGCRVQGQGFCFFGCGVQVSGVCIVGPNSGVRFRDVVLCCVDFLVLDKEV